MASTLIEYQDVGQQGGPPSAGRMRDELMGVPSKRTKNRALGKSGGEGGIRTPGTLSGTPVFKTGAINHSATSPDLFQFYHNGVLPRIIGAVTASHEKT